MFEKYLIFFLVATLVISEAAIQRYSKKDLLTQRQTVGVPIGEVLAELESRTKRSAGDPEFSRSALNDGHQIAQIGYSGQINSEVIFVLTYNILIGGVVTSSNVYRSTDYGNTFNIISQLIGDGATLSNNIYINPEDHTRVFFVDASSAILYVSEDEGVSFANRVLSPTTIDPATLLFHPTEKDWVLAHDPVNNALYVSRDFGITFTKIADDVTSNDRFQWGAHPYDSDASAVYYITNEVLYTQRYPYGDSTRKEFDPSLGAHDDFLMVDRYIFVQKTINSEITLWVSADRQPFRQAKIPSTYNHQNYFVDSIRSLQALVIIQHTNNQFNLYLSDEQGVFFYQSLSDITVEFSFTLGALLIDLEIVESMNYTTYIANQNVPALLSSYKQTLISFDAGANWNRITPPDNDTDCDLPLCSLHLHMSTSEYWRTGVYSQESAPGIIIAHGAVGEYLDDENNDEDAHLYISRDGGSTWSLTLEGTWGVRILDHGGLIVAARDHNNDKQKSRTLMYTCNEGMSWMPLTFTSINITIYGVLTEPGETTTVVSLFGIEVVNWVIVVVEFADIFSSVCEPDDYYNWTPFDKFASTGCLLGASVTIELRKPDVCCLNGNTYNRVIGYSTCDCTIEDFECDYGYKHANGFNGACVRDAEVTLDVACGNGEPSYAVSQGYRKIGGDVCSRGIESSFTPYNASCCYASADSEDDRFFIGFVIVTILLILCILVIISLVIWSIIKFKSLKLNASSFRHQQLLETSSQLSSGNIYAEPVDKALEAAETITEKTNY